MVNNKIVKVEGGTIQSSLGGDDLLVFFQDESGMTRAWAVGHSSRWEDVIQLATDHLAHYQARPGKAQEVFTGHVWNGQDHWGLVEFIEEVTRKEGESC